MTDTLRDIPREITEVLNENWVPSRVVYGTDEPDGFSSVRGWAAHVAEAILAIPGIAVVELDHMTKWLDNQAKQCAETAEDCAEEPEAHCEEMFYRGQAVGFKIASERLAADAERDQ